MFNAYMPDDKFVLIKFDNKFVDIMCDVNPELVEDKRVENGRNGIVLKNSKSFFTDALSLLYYGTISS